MKFHKKWDIHEQIRELRTILLLQDQGKKAFHKASEEILSQNKDTINLMRANVREDIKALSIAKKYEATTINQACKGRKKRRLAFTRGSVEQAKEAMKKYVFDSKNVLNKVTYEVKKRAKALEEMAAELETLKTMQLAENPDNVENQHIRQLENSIEKVDTKLEAAKRIHYTYLRILDYLKDEVVNFPTQLSVMETVAYSYGNQLSSMTLMADEASVAREAIQLELSILEKQFIQERKSRENTLSTQRKMVKEIVDRQLRKRDSSKKDRNMELPPLIDRETPVAAALKVETDKGLTKSQQKLITDIDKLKNAVECSHIKDIPERYMEQEATSRHLQEQLDQSNKKQEDLLSRLQVLELEHAKMKFHYKQDYESVASLDNELKNNIKLAVERLDQLKHRLLQNQQLRLRVQNGVDNLYIKLYGITSPDKSAGPTTLKETYAKLDVCQEKLLSLIQSGSSILQDEWIKDEHAETFVQVRNLLETSTAHEPRNQVVELEETDDSSKDMFPFQVVEHDFAPTREDIKKQSQRIIDMKSKGGRGSKKKKGAQKRS